MRVSQGHLHGHEERVLLPTAHHREKPNRLFEAMPKLPSMFLIHTHATEGGAIIISNAGETLVACTLSVCMIDTI